MNDRQVSEMAKLLKTMGHPIRLKILCLLQGQELTVGELHDQVQTSTANVSQHLTILRNQGIIDYRKDANFIRNRISEGRVVEMIKIMRELFCSEEEE